MEQDGPKSPRNVVRKASFFPAISGERLGGGHVNVVGPGSAGGWHNGGSAVLIADGYVSQNLISRMVASEVGLEGTGHGVRSET